MSDSKSRAIALLKDTSWLSPAASDELIESWAELMVPISASEGHIFVEEGLPIHHFMIIEEGILARTKLSADADDIPNIQKSVRSMSQSMAAAEINKHSVFIDTLSGRGRVTGILHSFQEGKCAYATVMARGDTRVWLVSSEAFREMLSNHPPFMLECMALLANQLRSGSKSLTSLLHNIKSSGKTLEQSCGGKSVLNVLCYDTTSWVEENFKPALEAYNAKQTSSADDFEIRMDFTTERLGSNSATYAAGYEAICTFVNDTADADTMQTLSRLGVGMIAQRAAGFDRIDTKAARAYGMTIARVPAYSPYAVAEMAVSLLLAVNRKIAKASARVKMANFTLDAGLMGMDIHGKTVGVIGTGKIGQILCNIMLGFGSKLICFDVYESDAVKEAGGIYVTQDELFAQSDIIYLMCPLLPSTRHIIDDESVAKFKPGVILVNTSRGGLIDTKAMLKGVRSGRIAGVGMDVYENEEDYFFQDWSARTITDPDLVALLGAHNIVMTAHQAFFTKEAVDKIVQTTIENLRDYKEGLTVMEHPNNCIPKLKTDA